MLIDEVVTNALQANRIKTYHALISDAVYDLFNPEKLIAIH